jgi:hypothetical protein
MMPINLETNPRQSLLSLTLQGNLSEQDFSQMNELVTRSLDAINESRVALVVNALGAKTVPRNFKQLQASQTFSQRKDLKWLLVVTDNKLIRLMMLLTYNLSRPSLRFFSTEREAMDFLFNMRHVAHGADSAYD